MEQTNGQTHSFGEAQSERAELEQESGQVQVLPLVPQEPRKDGWYPHLTLTLTFSP